MMKRYLMFCALTASCVMLAAGCKKKDHEEIDLSGIHTTAARETMAPTTAAPKETESETAAESNEESSSAAEAKNVSASVKTAAFKAENKNSKISIQYPEVANLSDSSKQEQVNELLKANAESFAEYFLDPEAEITAEIKCEVKSVDRNRLTAVYTGTYTAKDAAYPVSVFYANTVDLNQVKSLGFNDYSDAYTMAGYLMSDDVQFVTDSEDMTNALLEYRAGQTVEDFTALFNEADFPLKESEDGTALFPESFSYTDKGVLYFSIPVPHALGDYALVSFPMDGK